LQGLLAGTPLHPQAREVFDTTLARVLARAETVASAPRGSADASARQVGSALYHLSTAVAMAWEAGRTGSARRMRIAQLVLRHRLLPRDPLADDVEPEGLAGLLDPGLQAAEAVDQVHLL
ncbi:MAG: DNA alkylation response protein, partial [Burkholderiales bacterium PBB5]